MLFAHRVGGEMKKVLLSIISIFFCLGALVGGGLLLTGCDSPSSQTQPLEPGGGFDESQNENNAENDDTTVDMPDDENSGDEESEDGSLGENDANQQATTIDLHIRTVFRVSSTSANTAIYSDYPKQAFRATWYNESDRAEIWGTPQPTVNDGGYTTTSSSSIRATSMDYVASSSKDSYYRYVGIADGTHSGWTRVAVRTTNSWSNSSYRTSNTSTYYYNGSTLSTNRVTTRTTITGTVYVYLRKQCTVTYYSRGSRVGSDTFLAGVGFEVPESVSNEPADQSFIGWSYSQNTTVPTFEPGEKVSDVDAHDGIGELYAVFAPKLTIHYGTLGHEINVKNSTSINISTSRGTLSASSVSSGGTRYLTANGEVRHTLTFSRANTSYSYYIDTDSTATTSSDLNSTTYSWNSGGLVRHVYIYVSQRYTITYNANGGSGAPGSQYKAHGTNATLSSTKPTRSGYKFLGWSTSSSATSASYDPGDTFSNEGNTTLYAVWERQSYSLTINFEYNYGTYNVSLSVKTNRGTLSRSSMSEGGSVTLTSDGTTNTHTVTISETSPSPNYFYVGTSTTPSSLTTYTYSWTPTSNKSINIYTEQRYSITYNGNGNTGGSTSTTYYRYGSGTVASCGFTRTGYDFAGWATSANGGVVYEQGDTVRNTYLTLYAVWTRRSYTNYYYYRNTDGDQDSTTQTRYVSTNYTLLSSISDDYESNGWSLYQWGSSESATSGSLAGSTTSSTSTSTIEYYAISRRTVSISYSANGGSFSSTPSTTGTQYWNQYGNVYNNPRLSITSTVPTRTGYEFLGWSTSSTATSADYVYGSTYTFSNGYSSSASKTFYAVWEARNPAYYDSEGGFWYVENGKLPQSKVSESLKSTLSSSWGSLSNGDVYYMGVEELANSEFTNDGGMQSKVYNGEEYVKFNGEYYLVEPIRWRLVYSSSQQEGYAVENTSVLATMVEIVFVGSYSSTKIGAGEGYSAESVTMLLKNQVSTEFLVSESREVEIFGAPKDTASVSGSVFVASSEELANFTTSKNNTTGSGVKAGKVSLSDFVKDYLRATGQGDYYFTRDLGDQLNTIHCLNPVGDRSQAKTQQILGVQFTIKVTEYACKSV